jgi:hypothetical protein
MTSNHVLDFLRALIALPAAAFWPSVAWLLDQVRQIGGVSAGLIALGLLALPVAFAFAFQRHLNRLLEKEPRRRLGALEYLKLELRYSVLALPVWPFRLLVALGRAIGRLGRAATSFVQRRGRSKAIREEQKTAPPPAAVAEPALLVASLGPGFLMAGVATVGLYLVAKLVAPLLRAELGLSPGLSVWQYVLLGRRVELAWYLPLDRFPFLGGLLSLLLWIVVWSVIGIIVRCFWRRQVGRNLATDRDDRSVLPFWRRWSGIPSLWEPALSYREWAVWPVAAAIPFLGWAWFSVAGDPYRIPFADFAVGALLWTSWGLHLLLRGRERRAEKPQDEPAAGTEANGWLQVLERLQVERQVAVPAPFEERAAEPLLLSEVDPRTAGFLSPLVSNHLLPKPHKLTHMQRVVLTQLALQGYVHVDPPVALDRLSLGEDVLDVLQDRSGQRSRHQIVLAPEGSGKTTLALLAAANHALVHTRSTLVVVRDEESAERIADSFRHTLEPSPLRWNVRVRHPGADLMNDLSQGIHPDVVLCGLHDLVVTLLDRPDTFAPFLRNLGLIVVDDVESFAGPVEVHAQLAFRRLAVRVGELMGSDELGETREKSAPQVLVLGAESMHEMAKWARSLCGIDAVVRRFSQSARELGEQEAAEMAASGMAVEGADQKQPEARPPAAVEEVASHRFYRLRDFRTAAGVSLSLEELISTCERLAVPWHYRLCGDGRRELGRGPLFLREEPLHFAPAPEEACVVLLEGTWSEVRRERQRLTRAGARFSRFRLPGGEMVRRSGASPEPIAFVTVVDADLEMVLTQLDKSFGLAPALDSLPRPVLRPPTGLAVGPHLSADLTRHWIEVADLLAAFGTSTAETLRWLAEGRMLLCEPRTDVEERSNEYTEKVYVRALARAVRSSEEEGGPFFQVSRELLPPKVTQVEVAPRSLIAVRDRTDLVLLGQADDANAHFVFYPGKIFKDARGTFVVVGRAGDELGGSAAAPQSPARQPSPSDERGHGDILVEPLLADEISSPRRRFVVRSLRGGPAMAALLEAAGGSFPDPNLVLIGQYPFAMALEPVEVGVEHVATYRLGPVQGEIRQRTLLDQDTRQRYFGRLLPTVALALFPNPGARDEETADRLQEDGGLQPRHSSEPRLTIEQARVLAAALRALLPAVYRGGGDGLVVALHLEGEIRPDRELDPQEGLFLFDIDFGGNGTARAVYRDGVDLLLRLVRLAIERILSLARLRALHDEWGDEAEILAETRGEAAAGPGSAPSNEAAAPDEHVRHGLLQWLDSRLQPEGGMEIGAGAAGAREGSEQGEGDRFDLGRCWFSRDDAFSDLIWVKHRWRLPVRGEAMLDIAFDRKTEAAARAVAESPALLGAYRELYAALLASRAALLPDGTSRHAARGARFLVPEQREPRTAGELEPDRLNELHAQAVALSLSASPVLKPLAGALLEHAGGMALPGDLRTAQALAAFVQGIPFSVARAVRSEIRPPVSTLLYRLGDGRAKSLLLAVLLRRAGIDTGLFHSFADEDRTFAAIALPEPVPSGGDVPRHLESWSRAAGLPAAPLLWAELPGRSGEGTKIFVPISARTYADPWIGQVGRPETWAFLPLLLPEPPPDAEAQAGAGPNASPTASDEAEHESRF